MKLHSLLLVAGLGLLDTNLAAQADEHAIRCNASINVIEYLNYQPFFYSITVRSWSDLICWPGQPPRTAAYLASSAYAIVTHSSGNISLRFCKIGTAALNNQVVEVWHNGVKIDGDRLRMS